MVREYETKLYGKQLEEVGRFQPEEEINQRVLQRPQFLDSGKDTTQARNLSFSAYWSLPEQGSLWRRYIKKNLIKKIKGHAKRNGHHRRQIPSPTSLELFEQRTSVSICPHYSFSVGPSRSPMANNISFPCSPFVLITSLRCCYDLPCILIPFIYVLSLTSDSQPFQHNVSFYITSIL